MSRNQSRRGGNGANSIACLNAIANKSEKSKRCKRDRSDEWLADARDVETLRNLAFETYYKGRVVPTKEWNDFTLALHRSLPLALRINRNIPCASKIKQYIYSKLANVFETTPIKFYHNEFALQCTTSRGELKRNVTFKSLKRLITALNDGGYLSRQETVSMIPVVLLNVQPGDVVLDMCAAPGSKTTQILEMLITGMVDIDIEKRYMEHGSNCYNNYDHHTHNVVKNHTTYFEPYVNTVTGTNSMTSNTSNKNKISNSNNSNSNSNNSNSNSNITELASQITLSEHGVLVANDVNTSRLDVLVHQTNRVPHCHPHLIITNYDAARFPSLILSSQQSEKAINRASSLSLEEKEQYEEQQEEKEEEEEEEQEEEEQSEEQTTYELPPQENVQSEIDPVSEWRFHRVLCDVVCSGDGTLRKSLDLWPRWNTSLGVDLHKTQRRILMRGMELCKEHGVVVYSTCSLNPVEDEAVVLSCLQRVNGCFKLIDARPFLADFKSTDGLSSWNVMTPNLSQVFTNYEEVQLYKTQSMAAKEEVSLSDSTLRESVECVSHDTNSEINESAASTITTLQPPPPPTTTTVTTTTIKLPHCRTSLNKQKEERHWVCKLTETMFPPDKEIAEQYNIHYARRILPHHEDTGGFFVAALRCVKEIQTRRIINPCSATMKKGHSVSTDNEHASCKAKPLRLLSPEMKETVQRALNLPDTFPFHQLLYRDDHTRVQKIYYACDAALELMKYLGPRISHVGAKIFESYAKHCNDKLRYWPDGVRNLVPLLLETNITQLHKKEEILSSSSSSTSSKESLLQKYPTKLSLPSIFIRITARQLLLIASEKGKLTSNTFKRIINNVDDRGAVDIINTVYNNNNNNIKNNNNNNNEEEEEEEQHEEKQVNCVCNSVGDITKLHITPLFILLCCTHKFGNLYVAGEYRTSEMVEVHISEWQITLCKEECDLPLIELNPLHEENAEQ